MKIVQDLRSILWKVDGVLREIETSTVADMTTDNIYPYLCDVYRSLSLLIEKIEKQQGESATQTLEQKR